MTNDEALTTVELAEALSVHPETIRRWVLAGSIPHYRTPGGHLRFHLHAVREQLDKVTS